MKKRLLMIVILMIILISTSSCSSLDINFFGTHNKIIVNKTIIIYGDNNTSDMVGASLSDIAKGNEQQGGKLDLKVPAP